MFGSELIEVIIGIVGLFILLSIVCSAIREIVEVFQKAKPYYLHRMIYEMLDGEKNTDLVSEFYDHPEINCLFNGMVKCEDIRTMRKNWWKSGGNLPSYIPPRNFALAILDMVVRGSKLNNQTTSATSPPLNLLNARTNVDSLPALRLRRAVLMAIDLADGKYETAVKNLEKWFDTSTQRVSEQYKRHTSKIILVIALTIAGSLNINTINLIDYIYRQNTASHIAATGGNANEITPVPLGWNRSIAPTVENEGQREWLRWLGSLVGILITAFAASLGAPFWFDLLSKLAQLRTSAKPNGGHGENGDPPPIQASPSVQQASGSSGGVAPFQEDDEDSEGGYDGEALEVTKDEDLPPTIGGVEERSGR